MKKVIIVCACAIYLMSCGNGNSGSSEAEVEEVPSAIDTTTHPTGVNEGAVISTDTAAYNVENTNPNGRENLEQDRKDNER